MLGKRFLIGIVGSLLFGACKIPEKQFLFLDESLASLDEERREGII